MDVAMIETLQVKHPAWRLLRANNAPLILSFLGAHFVDANLGATPAGQIVSALDEHLFALRHSSAEAQYANDASSYLDSWSAPESCWLRRFYPPNSDEVHYDATADFEKAYSWVSGLAARSFIGTESRLHTIIELLRQIVHGTETDPAVRLAELRRRRDEIDLEIAEVQRGHVPVLEDTALRDRYQQFSGTARDLLSDFREVEENFRALDRAARERIASWEGSKGDLLAELVGTRADINSSDQGRSFQAFYDFLLSHSRQEELSILLDKVQSIDVLDTDRRLRTVHHDWSEAAERTQHTVRRLSEQLRRFLDDQIWLENRRVLDLVRSIEAQAIALRNASTHVGLEVDSPGIRMTLPFERPLHDARPTSAVDSSLGDATEFEEVDMSALFSQTFVDQARLADNIRAVVPARSTALLSDIVSLYPVAEGVAEIIGYLALNDDDIDVSLDDTDEMQLDYTDTDGLSRRVRLPQVTVSRR